jgi:hypothetical protein
MGQRFFQLPADEDALMAEIEARQEKIRAAMGQASLGRSEMASAWASDYPFIQPGVIDSLVQAGISPANPAGQTVVEMAAAQAQDEGAFEEATDDRLPRSWAEALGERVTRPTKGLVRGAFIGLSRPPSRRSPRRSPLSARPSPPKGPSRG